MLRTIFPSLKRKSLSFGAVALSTIVLTHATTALAGTASLVMADMCDDPAAAFDYEWSRVKHGSADLYFMAANGAVSAITAHAAPFNNYETIYVAAHGSNSTVGGFSHANFATNLEAAHTAIPDTVFLAVCNSAAGPNSLMKTINTEYGDNVNKLSGAAQSCALTGNGNTALASADYLDAPTPSNSVTYNTIVQNIMTKWGQNFPNTNNDYQAECQARTGNFNQASVKQFIDTVLVEFSQPPARGNPNLSTNYLDLVGLNTGGNAMTVCGQNPAGNGPVNCP